MAEKRSTDAARTPLSRDITSPLTIGCGDAGQSGGVPLLRAEGVEFGFGPATFLSVDRLELWPGELLGLLGPNGAGKSTYLRLLAGLTTPRKGVVYICGQSVENVSPEVRARWLAWVPQRSETPFEWTVSEMVALGRYPHHGRALRDRSEDRYAVAKALSNVGLSTLQGRAVGTLSGGEWQRALLGRALAQDAGILLLDEPVASLDLAYQRRIYELVRSLCRDHGVGAIVADHHIDLQAAFCDRLLLMDGGRVVAQGTPAEVLTSGNLEAAFRTPLQVEVDSGTGRPRVRWRFEAERTGEGGLP
jgi:ABC-type cobalamin/Fe3+-siderophores transport system ATPase subunit